MQRDRRKATSQPRRSLSKITGVAHSTLLGTRHRSPGTTPLDRLIPTLVAFAPAQSADFFGLATRGSLQPSAFSNLAMMALLGMALPLSYSFTICGCMLSCCRGKQAGTGQPRLAAQPRVIPSCKGAVVRTVASCFCVMPLAVRAFCSASFSSVGTFASARHACRRQNSRPQQAFVTKAGEGAGRAPACKGPGAHASALPTTCARARRRCADPMEARGRAWLRRT